MAHMAVWNCHEVRGQCNRKQMLMSRMWGGETPSTSYGCYHSVMPSDNWEALGSWSCTGFMGAERLHFMWRPDCHPGSPRTLPWGLSPCPEQPRLCSALCLRFGQAVSTVSTVTVRSFSVWTIGPVTFLSTGRKSMAVFC